MTELKNKRESGLNSCSCSCMPISEKTLMKMLEISAYRSFGSGPERLLDKSSWITFYNAVAEEIMYDLEGQGVYVERLSLEHSWDTRDSCPSVPFDLASKLLDNTSSNEHWKRALRTAAEKHYLKGR